MRVGFRCTTTSTNTAGQEARWITLGTGLATFMRESPSGDKVDMAKPGTAAERTCDKRDRVRG